jgi:hypothetical protein
MAGSKAKNGAYAAVWLIIALLLLKALVLGADSPGFQ